MAGTNMAAGYLERPEPGAYMADGLRSGISRRPQPGEHPAPISGRTQLNGLRQKRHTQPVSSTGPQGTGDLDGAVPIGIGLHDSHHRYPARREASVVAGYRRQIHLRARPTK